MQFKKREQNLTPTKVPDEIWDKINSIKQNLIKTLKQFEKLYFRESVILGIDSRKSYIDQYGLWEEVIEIPGVKSEIQKPNIGIQPTNTTQVRVEKSELMNNIWSVLFSIFVSLILGYFSGNLLNHATKKAKPGPPEPLEKEQWEKVFVSYSAGRWVGELECLLFLAALWTGSYILIVAWLGFKVAAKWEVWGNVIKVPAALETVPELNYLQARNAWGTWLFSRFLIGTITNLLIAFVAFSIGKHLLPLFIQLF